MDHRRDPTRGGAFRVLIASVSADDRGWVERTCADAGFEVRVVLGAREAEDEIDACAGACVLVIDSGILQMPHDGAWRDLRARHPGLGTVIRCLPVKNRGTSHNGDRTFLVPPECPESLLAAVGAFRASGAAG